MTRSRGTAGRGTDRRPAGRVWLSAAAVLTALLVAGSATSEAGSSRPAPGGEVGTHGAGQTASVAAVAVASSRRLSGEADDHSWLIPGARWDACRPIDVAVNTQAMRGTAAQRAGFVREVRWAAAQVNRASGLRLRVVGATRALPQPNTANPDGVDIVVAWARPGASRWLTDDRFLGYGGARAVSRRLQDGFVLLNTDQSHRYPASRYPGDRRAWNRRVTVLHELGHAVGAGHARSTSQIMYPRLAGHAYRFGRGDRAILRKLGADRSACS